MIKHYFNAIVGEDNSIICLHVQDAPIEVIAIKPVENQRLVKGIFQFPRMVHASELLPELVFDSGIITLVADSKFLK